MTREVIVAVFPSRTMLTKALDHITSLRNVAVQHAAVVTRAADGKLIILDDSLGAYEGGFAGGIVGGILTAFGFIKLGALTLPGWWAVAALGIGIVLGMAIGIVIGRFVARFIASNFGNVDAESIINKMQAGHLALVLVVKKDQAMLAQLMRELNLLQAEFVDDAFTLEHAA